MQLTKWIPLPLKGKNRIWNQYRKVLPRYSANRYPVLDSLYKTIKSNSLVKSGNQYKTIDFEDEKNHHNHFRNNGVYYFQPTYVNFDIDTIKKENKADVNIIINNYSIKITTQLKRSLLKSIKLVM
jgi:hypothetical protein